VLVLEEVGGGSQALYVGLRVAHEDLTLSNRLDYSNPVSITPAKTVTMSGAYKCFTYLFILAYLLYR